MLNLMKQGSKELTRLKLQEKNELTTTKNCCLFLNCTEKVFKKNNLKTNQMICDFLEN